MKVELFIQDEELGLEFDLKFVDMDALTAQIFNLTGIINRAKLDKTKEERRLAEESPATFEGYQGKVLE